MSVDMTKYSKVLHETFDEGLRAYDGQTGIWSLGPRNDKLVTNSPQSVFLDGDEKTSDGTALGLDPISVEDGVLHIGSGVIPDDKLDAVRDVLAQVGQEKYTDKTSYYTGMITSQDSWAQQYGYFEVTAQVPEGRGHWSAFWLAPGGYGWPPEIDIFEAYGRGVHQSTPKDDVFNVAVFFDAIDPDGNATQEVDITNPYQQDATGADQDPIIRNNKGGTQYQFIDSPNARADFGADIYDNFWTYATEWTPDEIIFYFGPDREHLVEIYRTPTPEDLNSPMVMIANDQIGSTWGWNPVEGHDHLTFAQDNDLKIDSISVYALNSERTLAGTGQGAILVDGDARSDIIGTAGDDLIAGGGGLDMITLGGGADTVFVERGTDNEIISGFGADDRVILEGFNFDSAQDALARLTQVDGDVWLINGADPANPQTILFRDMQVEDFTTDQIVARWSVTRDIWASPLKDGTWRTDADGDGHVWAEAGGSRLNDANSSADHIFLHGSSTGDIYTIYSNKSEIIENADGGVDTVYARRSFTLSDHVENIIGGEGRHGLVLTGNDLDNRLESGGDQVLIGAGGNDLYVLGNGGATEIRYGAGDGHDTITGFGADDVLALSADFAFASWADLQARLGVYGTDLVLDLGHGQSLTFRDTALDDLGAQNFSYRTGPTTQFEGQGFDPLWRPSGPVDGDSLPGDEQEAGFSLETWLTTVAEAASASDPALLDAYAGHVTSTDIYGWIQTDDEAGHLILGDADNQICTGNIGTDCLFGGAGDDRLYGKAGADALLGEAGNDRLHGGDGGDTLLGGAGDDLLWGNDGADSLLGGAGADVLGGGADADRLAGGDGDDLLRGDAGADILLGDAGADTLRGGDGDDRLDGGAGTDQLEGNAGADIFVLGGNDAARDLVMDYDYAQGDRIDLGALGAAQQIRITQGGRWTQLSVRSDGDTEFHDIASFRQAWAEDIRDGLLHWQGEVLLA